MSLNSKHFIYPHHEVNDPLKGKGSHILLHGELPRWMVLNGSALEISELLLEGVSVPNAAEKLVTKYGISQDIALKDVGDVTKKLEEKSFLTGHAALSPERKPKIGSSFLHLTNSCNLSCHQCYTSSPRVSNKESLPEELVYRLVDELCDNEGKSITLSGGEPLLHPNLKDIIKYIGDRLTIRLLTNGTLIDEGWSNFLSAFDIHVQISIDGSSSEVHDSIRGEGSFDRAVKAVNLLQDAGLTERINFSTTIMGRNFDDLEAIVSLAENMDVPLVRFLPLRNTGNAKFMLEATGRELTSSDYESFFQRASALQKGDKSSIALSCGLSGFVLEVSEALSEDGIWCPVGKMVVIDSNGDAYPCVLMMQENFKLGNVYDSNLSTMISSMAMKNSCSALSERPKKIEKCAGCSWRSLCQSGCMGEALEQSGTVWNTDHFCEYRKGVYKEAFDKILAKDL